jgi:hypothetical protein
MDFILDFILKRFGLDPNTNRLSWREVVVLSLIPGGQLYARVAKFKGTLDKWWMMFPLALFPPLSFIPMILMKYGYVADGKGADPVDRIMLLPIIAKFILPFIMPYLVDKESRITNIIVSFIFKLLFVMICNLYRRYDNCNNTITMDSVGKAGIDSVIATSAGDVVPIAMNHVPIVGTLYSILSMFPIIGNPKVLDSIFWSVGFGATYVLINMFNQVNMEKLCSTPFTGNLEDRVPFYTAIIALIVAHAFNYLVDGDLPDDDDEDAKPVAAVANMMNPMMYNPMMYNPMMNRMPMNPMGYNPMAMYR